MARIVNYRESKKSFSENYSMRFNGFDQRFITNGTQPITNLISISGWFKTSISGYQIIFCDAPSDVLSRTPIQPFIVHVGDRGSLFFVVTTSGGVQNTIVSSTEGLANGEWHHFACVYDGGQNRTSLKIYIDGSFDSFGVAFGTGIFNLGGLDNGFAVGSYSNPNPVPGQFGYFNGLIDEIAVWDSVVLDADQIESIYNSGAPGDLTPYAPTHWWRMGESTLFDGTNWLMPDVGGSLEMDSENMNITARTTDVSGS
jgi:hypothetical protein